MKLLFSILLVLLSINGFAQNWAPFPLSETSTWTENYGQHSIYGTWNRYQYNCYVAGTNSFSGNEYFRIDYTGLKTSTSMGAAFPESHQSISGTRGYIRQDSGVYYTWGPGEDVWFDFNVSEGDTVREYLVVDSIAMIDVGGASCRKVHLRDEWSESHWIIEGVGHSGGLFNPIYHEFTSGSLCYKENDIPLVYSHQNNCDLLSSIDGLEVNQVYVSPNPSTGIFNLDFQEQFTVQVYDLFGKLVLEGNSSGQTSIDLTAQPSGIYLLKVYSQNGISSVRLAKQ